MCKHRLPQKTVYMHTYMHRYIYTCTYTYAYLRSIIYLYSLRVYILIVCTHTCYHLSYIAHEHVCAILSLSLSLSLSLILTHTQTHTHTHTQTHTHTHTTSVSLSCDQRPGRGIQLGSEQRGAAGSWRHRAPPVTYDDR